MFDAQLLLCILFILAAQSTTESVRAMDMSVFEGQQFHCVDTSCAPFATATVSDLFNCQVACLARFQCKAARFDRSTLRCDLFGNLFSFNGSMLSNYNVTTSMVPTGRRTPPESQGNWVYNGDGETGPCEAEEDITPPTGWITSGPITQALYGIYLANQGFTDPGPSDRGRCHFYGHWSGGTTMWQMSNLTMSFDPVLIDNQTLRFDFSAWIGGYVDQDDYAEVSLTFFDAANQGIGNSTTLGPVSAADRNSTTSLLFRQASGQVPVGARAFKVEVVMVRLNGTYDDGDVDNILLRFHQ